jgi:hypothetical protein
MPLVRLNKYLAEHGVASRRRCDELIARGKVLVDGKPVSQLGTKIDPAAARVEVEGRVFAPDSVTRLRYYLLNKPKGVICTNDRHEARRRAIDLITDPEAGRIYTVGRLDEESTGLMRTRATRCPRPTWPRCAARSTGARSRSWPTACTWRRARPGRSACASASARSSSRCSR